MPDYKNQVWLSEYWVFDVTVSLGSNKADGELWDRDLFAIYLLIWLDNKW